MKILVTGGLGFIGSHTVVALINEGYKVVIIDDLSNSSIDVLEGITGITGVSPEFHQIDLREKAAVEKFFEEHDKLDGVIHFAASKAVGESVEKPLLYYENNINALVLLLQEMRHKQLSNFIFSSSCTVYGQADNLPITEEAPIKKAESPYGNTKQIGEEILKDFGKAEDFFKAVSLRYFNPIGAHPSAEIGELPLGVPRNLVPFVTQTAAGKREKLQVFGDDYDTPDGTCIRDYIHVMDLAEAHVAALNKLMSDEKSDDFQVYNLGTGQGNSVLEVVKTFEQATGENLSYEIVGRREGDITAAYADTAKANKELGWKTRFDLSDALKSAWKWQKTLD